MRIFHRLNIRSRVAAPVLWLAAAGMAGCALSPERVAELDRLIEAERSADLTCPADRPGRCALDSDLSRVWDHIEGGHHRGHQVIILDQGPDALTARVHLIRAASERIALQSYIFHDDGAGRALLEELLAAARRGVRVRILADALFSLPDAELQARLALAHQNLELRLYNPLFERAVLGGPAVVAGAACCFRALNHRMHNKLLAVDGRHAVIGGRNLSDRYFDLDTRTNFADMEVLVTGPRVADMEAGFEVFCDNPRTRPAAHVRDVARELEGAAAPEPAIPPAADRRVRESLERAADPGWLRELVAANGFAVERLEYFTDPPGKPWLADLGRVHDSTWQLHRLIGQARSSVAVMTPYFVLSPRFHRELAALDEQVTVRVVTNSLASTDAFPVYSISRRQRYRMVDGLGIHLYEFKPFPADRERFLPRYRQLIQEKGAGVSSAMRGDPRPATREMPGPRVSLHGKALVVDSRITVVTSHNFDPRSEVFNTENGIIVDDPDFAAALEQRIGRFGAPGNSWVVAPKNPAGGVLAPLNRALARASRRLPTLDLWPAYLTENYRLTDGAGPVPPDHPEFDRRYEPVGELPEVVRRQRLFATQLISRMFGFLRPIM